MTGARLSLGPGLALVLALVGALASPSGAQQDLEPPETAEPVAPSEAAESAAAAEPAEPEGPVEPGATMVEFGDHRYEVVSFGRLERELNPGIFKFRYPRSKWAGRRLAILASVVFCDLMHEEDPAEAHEEGGPGLIVGMGRPEPAFWQGGFTARLTPAADFANIAAERRACEAEQERQGAKFKLPVYVFFGLWEQEKWSASWQEPRLIVDGVVFAGAFGTTSFNPYDARLGSARDVAAILAARSPASSPRPRARPRTEADAEADAGADGDVSPDAGESDEGNAQLLAEAETGGAPPRPRARPLPEAPGLAGTRPRPRPDQASSGGTRPRPRR